MKNLLWFFYKPNDEREELIYNKAFSRAYSTLIVGIAIIMLAVKLAINITLNPDNILAMLAVIALLSYLAGWTALRNEDLTLTYTEKADKNSKHSYLF